MYHEGSNQIYAAEGSDFCLPADFDGANYKTGELCLMPTKQHWLVKKLHNHSMQNQAGCFTVTRVVFDRNSTAPVHAVYSKFWFCD